MKTGEELPPEAPFQVSGRKGNTPSPCFDSNDIIDIISVGSGQAGTGTVGDENNTPLPLF